VGFSRLDWAWQSTVQGPQPTGVLSTGRRPWAIENRRRLKPAVPGWTGGCRDEPAQLAAGGEVSLGVIIFCGLVSITVGPVHRREVVGA